MPPPLRDRARTLRNGLVAWVGARGPDLAMQLTLLDLLLVPVGAWSVRPAVLVVAAAGLLHRSVLRSPWTWLLLFFLTGWRVVDEHHLEREYEFEDFRGALDFTVAVGDMAEEQGLREYRQAYRGAGAEHGSQ